LPFDGAVAILLNWRNKNLPIENKRIITQNEVEEQVNFAFTKVYSGFGCEDPIINAFCDQSCPVKMRNF
jgi:hypothetical protein